jgi:hypothetical protein
MSHNKIRLSTLSLTKIKRAPHKMEAEMSVFFGPDLARASFKRRLSTLALIFPQLYARANRAGESGARGVVKTPCPVARCIFCIYIAEGHRNWCCSLWRTIWGTLCFLSSCGRRQMFRGAPGRRRELKNAFLRLWQLEVSRTYIYIREGCGSSASKGGTGIFSSAERERDNFKKW